LAPAAPVAPITISRRRASSSVRAPAVCHTAITDAPCDRLPIKDSSSALKRMPACPIA